MKICYIISDIDKAVYFEQTALALRNKGMDASYILINCTGKKLHHFLYSIDAFKILLSDYPNARLYLFGASENADYSVEIKNKLNLIPAKNICIVPFENNVFDLYQLFDIYIHVPVNPSCEAFGQTYVEALAAGIPSVFTLSGVAQEFIVHEENALVVPFKDSNAIYKAMLRLLNDLSLREKLSAEGFQSVSRMFSFEDYIRNLQKLYRS